MVFITSSGPTYSDSRRVCTLYKYLVLHSISFRIFTVKTPTGINYKFYPLTCQFGLIHVVGLRTRKYEHSMPLNSTGRIKPELLERRRFIHHRQSIATAGLLVDRAGQQDGGKINFFLYSYNNTHQRCQLDVVERNDWVGNF